MSTLLDIWQMYLEWGYAALYATDEACRRMGIVRP
jgi:hypothetical protein